MPAECAEPFGRPRDRCERRKRNVLPSAGDNRKRYRDDVVTREHEPHRLSPLLRTVRRTRPRLGEGFKGRALLMSIRAIRVHCYRSRPYLGRRKYQPALPNSPRTKVRTYSVVGAAMTQCAELYEMEVRQRKAMVETFSAHSASLRGAAT